MEQWHCFKCRVGMEEKDILMEFMEITRYQPGLKCPKCGAAYMLENVVIDVINPGEKEIEEKF